MKILLLSDDLMSRVRIESRWKAAGAQLLKNDSAVEPDLIVVDLGVADALESISRMHNAHPGTDILAFGPHVDGDAFRQAKAAGATHLVARGKLVEKVLARIAGGG
ncbi:MAG: response regulator [Acidiferrobacterales bacterium]